MKRPIIGIAANEIQNSGEVLHEMPILYTPLGYVKAIQKAGALAMVIPISEKEAAKEYISQIDNLVLAGGQNVSTKFYGQQLETEEDYSYLARDEFELALIDEALVQKKPIFAVCRGMQLVNVAFGGDLQQKIDETKGIRHMQAPIPRAVPTHGIQTLDQSMIQSLYGTHNTVNSFHHQAVNRLSSNFTETAWSPDNVIEAIEDPKHSILAVQWHPDFAYEELVQEMGIFQYVANHL